MPIYCADKTPDMSKTSLGKFINSRNCKDLMDVEKIKILEKRLDELEKLNEKERIRRETIRSKGNIIIGITSLVSGVIIAMSIFIQKEADITKPWLIIFAIITVALTISIFLVILFIFKTTHKDKVSLLGPEDLRSSNGQSYKNYLESLIAENEKVFDANKTFINKKVDHLISANVCVLITSVIFVVYTVLLLIWVCVRPAKISETAPDSIDIELNWNQTNFLSSDSIPHTPIPKIPTNSHP